MPDNGGFGGAAKGAAGGALAGSAILPGWGTAIGGVVGGIAGYLGGGDEESDNDLARRKMLMDYYAQIQGRQAPQMGPASQADASTFRGNQAALIKRLEAMSRGEGPSLAMEQLKQSTDRLGSQQASIANSGRGGPLAAQQAANNTAFIGAQAAQSGMQGRIAEQQNALNLLGLNIHGARGQDESLSQFNASQQNAAAQANLEARLRAMGYNDAAIAAILSELGGQNKAQNAAAQVQLGDQIMAGGAGMYAQASAQRAAERLAEKNKGKA